MRIRNCIFVAIICFFVSGPALLFCADKASVTVPEWLGNEQARYLAGGFSNSSVKEVLNLNGFVDGKLQKALEGKIGNAVPAKAMALLGSAALQRAAISCSAWIMQENCWPTYYGSSIVYDPDNNALFQMPLKGTETNRAGVKKFGNKLALIAKKFPSKQFVVVVADNSNTSEANSAFGKVSDCFSTSETFTLLKNECTGVSNICLVNTSHYSANDYLRDYYSTDHHWNGWGALSAYYAAIEERNPSTAKLTSEMTATTEVPPRLDSLNWLRENGSTSRNGLMLLDEIVNEPQFDFESINVGEGEAPCVLTNDGAIEMRRIGPIASFDFYQTWYGQWVDTVAYNNRATKPNAAALVICDSFGTAFKWVASMDYGTVTALYDLHDSRCSVISLAQTLENTGSETVFIVGRATSFSTVLERFPDYLD